MSNPFEQIKAAIPIMSTDELTEIAQLINDRLEAEGASKPSQPTTKKRKGGYLPFWLKHITDFDESKQNGYSFKGEFIHPDKITTLHDGELILFGKGKGDDACFALLEKEYGVTTDVFRFKVDHAKVIATSEANRWMPNEHQKLHGKPIAPVWKAALDLFRGP